MYNLFYIFELNLQTNLKIQKNITKNNDMIVINFKSKFEIRETCTVQFLVSPCRSRIYCFNCQASREAIPTMYFLNELKP